MSKFALLSAIIIETLKDRQDCLNTKFDLIFYHPSINSTLEDIKRVTYLRWLETVIAVWVDDAKIHIWSYWHYEIMIALWSCHNCVLKSYNSLLSRRDNIILFLPLLNISWTNRMNRCANYLDQFIYQECCKVAADALISALPHAWLRSICFHSHKTIQIWHIARKAYETMLCVSTDMS